MEVLYHIRPYFVGIFPHIGLKNRPCIWQVPPFFSVPEMAIETSNKAGLLSLAYPQIFAGDDTYPLVNVYIAIENHHLQVR